MPWQADRINCLFRWRKDENYIKEESIIDNFGEKDGTEENSFQGIASLKLLYSK